MDRSIQNGTWHTERAQVSDHFPTLLPCQISSLAHKTILKPSMAHLAWGLLKPSRFVLIVASTYPAQPSSPS